MQGSEEVIKMNKGFSSTSEVIGGFFVMVKTHSKRTLWSVGDLFRIESYAENDMSFKCSWASAPHYHKVHGNANLYILPSEFRPKIRRAYKNEEFLLKRIIKIGN